MEGNKLLGVRLVTAARACPVTLPQSIESKQEKVLKARFAVRRQKKNILSMHFILDYFEILVKVIAQVGV